jgi:putative membrane protein
VLSRVTGSALVLALGFTASYALMALGDEVAARVPLLLAVLASLAISLKEWSGAPLLVLFGMLVGFLSELAGLSLGLPFSRYTYLRFEQARVLGVPVPVVLAWGIYLYASYMASMTLAAGRRARLLLAPALMVLLDLAIDPVMVEAGFWRWYGEGPWFGIPTENFAGWFLVSLASCALYARLTRREPGGGNPLLFLPYLSAYLTLFHMAGRASALPVSLSFAAASLLFGYSIARYARSALATAGLSRAP